MAKSWSFLILIGLLASPAHLLGQLYPPQIPRDPDYMERAFMEKGIQCTIEPLDSMTMALIPDVGAILEAATSGVKAAGWEVRSSSPFAIMVSLQSRGKAKDGADLIRISISVSEREAQGEEFGRSAHPLVATSTRRIAEARDPGVAAAAEQMTADIAMRLRMDLLKRAAMRRNREQTQPLHNERNN